MLLVTVSDDRAGRKEGRYRETQLKVQKIFENNPQFGIDKFMMRTVEDIVSDPAMQNHPALNDVLLFLQNTDATKNGRIYKPLVVAQALANTQPGDYVVYQDVSPEMWTMPEDYKIPETYDINVLKRLCDENDGLLAALVIWDNRPIKLGELGIHTHENFTLDRCMRAMELERFAKSFMPASGLIVVKNTLKTLNTILDWYEYCLNPECSSMGKPSDPNDYSFWDEEQYTKLGMRSDQSVLGLLMCRDGYNLIKPSPDNGVPPHCLLRYCRPDIQYEFVDPNINPSTERRIRKGDKVINAAGTELTVWEIRANETLIVGKHPESCYATTADKVTLVE